MVRPSALTCMPRGAGPTGIVRMTRFVVRSTTLTVPSRSLLTHATRLRCGVLYVALRKRSRANAIDEIRTLTVPAPCTEEAVVHAATPQVRRLLRAHTAAVPALLCARRTT